MKYYFGTRRDDGIMGFGGLSTDIKPSDVSEGSVFVEGDTGISYIYRNHKWRLINKENLK